MSTVANKLSDVERTRYFECRDLIRENIVAFFDVGDALKEIRDSRLYREEFDTFEVFCSDTYKMKGAHAYRLIKAAEIKAEVGDAVQNESQARALAAVPKPKRAAVLDKAAKDGPVTARSITEAAEPPKPAKPETIELDRTGFKIPAKLLPLWERSKEVQAILTGISRIRTALRAAQEQDDPLWRPVASRANACTWSKLLSSLDDAYAKIGLAMPFAVCPVCQGHLPTNCTVCQERGFVSEFYYKNCLDADSKKVRETVCQKKKQIETGSSA